MGIKLLNRLIQTRCKNSHNLIPLMKLKGKIIVVDISIYLYRFKSRGVLIENMYLMCGIFRYYDIIPLFIFDGVPPAIKDVELNKRKCDKIKAFEKYKILSQRFGESHFGQRNMREMERLRRMMTTINRDDINNVKEIISLYGLTYIVASKEADEICAALVKSGKAYACLSEDTDLFVYGCPLILRYLSLKNHTVVLYNYNKVLCELNLSDTKFRELCVISGTDYNRHENMNIINNYELYKGDINIYLTKDQTNIYDIFDIKNNNIFDNLLIENGTINKLGLVEKMKDYNFVFV